MMNTKILQLLKMLSKDSQNVYLKSLNDEYKGKFFPDNIAPYIIKQSLAQFDVKLNLSLLKKVNKNVLQKIYPGLISFYINLIGPKKNGMYDVLDNLLYVLNNTSLKNREKIFVANFVKNTGIYDKDLYMFFYNEYKIAFFGLRLLQNNVDINITVIEQEIENILDLITTEDISPGNNKGILGELHQDITNISKYTYINHTNLAEAAPRHKKLADTTLRHKTVDKYEPSSRSTEIKHESVNSNNKTRENIVLKCKTTCSEKRDANDLQTKNAQHDNNYYTTTSALSYLKDKTMQNTKKMISWPENDLFDQESDFIRFLVVHCVKLRYNAKIQNYVKTRKDTMLYKAYKIRKTKVNFKMVDLEENFEYLMRKVSPDIVYDFVANNPECVQPHHIRKIILFCLSDKKFTAKKCKLERFGDLEAYIISNYAYFVGKVIELLQKPVMTQKALQIFVNLLKSHYNQTVIKALNIIFDKLYEQDDVKVYLLCLYKITKLRVVDRSCVYYIFNELLYLDKKDCRVRCCVYNIMNILMKDYYKMDKHIEKTNKDEEEHIKTNAKLTVDTQKLDSANMDNKPRQKDAKNNITPFCKAKSEDRLIKRCAKEGAANDINVSCVAEQKDLMNVSNLAKTNNIMKTHVKIKSRIQKIDYKRLDKKNVKVLAAKIWEDFVDEKEMLEYICSLRLLVTIINCTGNFYERRIQKSKVFDKIVEAYKKFNKKADLNYVFYKFVNVVLKHFVLTKKNFATIYDLCVEYESLQCEKILKKLIGLDFYFVYYLAKTNRTDFITELIKNTSLN